MAFENLKNIFLMGFMGSGKSTLGTHLSRLLSYNYIDLDKRFYVTTGKNITDFFLEKSEEEFRKVESNILKSIPVDEKVVVACGGGTPCFYDNIDWMNKNGLTVFLNVSNDFLYQRLRYSKANRPLIKAMGNEELKKYIGEELTQREPFYKKAKMTISGEVNAQRLRDQIVQYYEFIEIYQNREQDEKTFNI